MSDLRIAVLGVGMMGADHVARITSRISGAQVAVVNDYLPEKAGRSRGRGRREPAWPTTRSTRSPPTTSTRWCSPPRARRTKSNCWPASNTASRCCARSR